MKWKVKEGVANRNDEELCAVFIPYEFNQSIGHGFLLFDSYTQIYWIVHFFKSFSSFKEGKQIFYVQIDKNM